MTDKRKFFRAAGAEIDLRLGDLLGELGSMLEAAAERLDDAEEGEIRRESTFQTERGPIRASAGIRIRSASGGSPAAHGVQKPKDAPINRPSPRREPPPSPEPPITVRTIEATILDEPASWTLVADVPGITRDDLTLSSDGGGVVIEAEGQGRRYRGRFELPEDLSVEDLTCRMRNGVLELIAARTESGT